MNSKLLSKADRGFRRFVVFPLYKRSEEKNKKSGLTLTHVSYYAISNCGDTVLSKCVRKTFECFLGDINWKLILVSDDVDEKIIEKINKTDGLVIGGGGLFISDDKKCAKSGWRWPITPELLEKIKVPVIVYTPGYNFFRGQRPSEKFVKAFNLLADKASFFGLRNRGSVENSTGIVDGENSKKIIWQPCTTTMINRLYKEIPEKKETNTVAFNCAFDRSDKRYGEDRELILSQIADAAKAVSEKGYEIRYISHVKTDEKFLPYLDRAGVKYKAVDMSMWLPEKIIEYYNNVDLVFGMRGHAQMIPFGVNTEIISMGTHDKLKYFLEDINEEGWYVELGSERDTICERLLDTFERIHETGSAETKKAIRNKQDILWKITSDNMQEIKKILIG